MAKKDKNKEKSAKIARYVRSLPKMLQDATKDVVDSLDIETIAKLNLATADALKRNLLTIYLEDIERANEFAKRADVVRKELSDLDPSDVEFIRLSEELRSLESAKVNHVGFNGALSHWTDTERKLIDSLHSLNPNNFDEIEITIRAKAKETRETENVARFDNADEDKEIAEALKG